MDVFLSSAAMEPPGAQAHYRERLVCLPGLSLYLQPPLLPPVAKGRREFGLPEDGFLMLCSQSLFKLLPAKDWVYVRLLEKLPQAHLVLISGDGQPVFQKRLQEALKPMVLEERVTFLPEMNHADFLDLNRCADLFLDGLAWSGGQTTLEAVACGLLPVTAPGPYMRMRHTAAILEELGLPELIAPDLEGLVERVLRLAQEPEWAASLRVRMREALPRLYQDVRALRALEDWMVEACRT
jgi:predicted O-linked N-acetylglucosamine transferase (SPINDLY family)